MKAILVELYRLGVDSLELFWMPLMLWTILALLIEGGLRLITRHSDGKKVFPLYQYHVRVAVLLALPIGFIVSFANYYLVSYWSPDILPMVKWIEIQAPVISTTAVASTANDALSLMNPSILTGLAVIGLLSLGAVALTITSIQLIRLYQTAKRLDTMLLTDWGGLSSSNHKMAKRNQYTIALYFDDEADIPYTFGWRKPVIVIPTELQQSPEKANLVIRHELMHIQQHDYPINTLLLIIRSLFVIHPLVHVMHRTISYWREITCDAEVLSDTTISTRSYANLLLELATNQAKNRQPILTMAADSSTLKQRLTDMKYINKKTSSIKRSLTLIAAGIIMISGIMACSDIQEGGITAAELEESRVKGEEMEARGVQMNALINGDPVEGGMGTIARIKEGYIKEVKVLTPKDAKEKLGLDVSSKVLNVIVHDKKLALNDLYTHEEMKKLRAQKNEERGMPSDTYVMVEQMPELIGGMQSIMKNVDYPELAKKAGIEGRVYIQFVVDEDGKVINPRVIKGIGGGCDVEALNAVKQVKFTPGYQDGKPVKVQLSLPVVFKLPNGDKQKAKS